jgi:hypothetical protein
MRLEANRLPHRLRWRHFRRLLTSVSHRSPLDHIQIMTCPVTYPLRYCHVT